MKYMLLAYFASLSLTVAGQITVTNATFPAIGDTLRTAVDLEPDLPTGITSPGGPQMWDFSNLKKSDTNQTVYRAAAAGNQSAKFPGADMVVIGAQSETYFKKSASKLEALGYAGADPAGFGLDVTAKFSPNVALRRAPMNFFDINQSVTDLTVPFSTEALPDSLLGGIPGVGAIDSMRVRINYNRLDAVDGYGTLRIPGGDYPVLREKRTEYTTTKLDVKVPFLGWVDVATLLGGGGGGGGLLGFLGVDTTITYHFFSGTEKETIAVVTADNANSTVTRVTFKDNTTSAVKDTDAPGNASVNAFPNPAVEWVRFDCYNLPADEYTFKIYNIVGKAVWKETHQLAGNRSVRVELGDFKKGTYLYSLTDGKGNVIGTKRLVVVKP